MTRAGTARQTQQQQPPPAVVGPSSGVFDSTSGNEFFDLQREAGNRVVGDWLKARVNNSAFQETGAPVVQPHQPIIQRKPANNASENQADSAAEPRTETGSVARSLIVEDDARSIEAGQMRKSEFLTELRTATTSAAEEVLAGTMWSAMGCPYIERWFGHYEGQSAQHVERAVQRFTPETRGARNARDYIPLVTNRLRRGIEQWRETGEVPPDMPEEFASGGMPGMTAGALIGGLVGGAVSAIGSAVSSAASSIGRALFKEREGGAEEANDPAAIKGQLGSGRSLDGTSKSRMESAYGADFSNVRIHTDAKAHELSNSLNARAFTIGSDIAFGSGEYNPGTPVGDALIAHELAHVAQQRGADSALPLQKHRTDSSTLEEDADDSAVSAVVKLWSRSKLGLAHVGQPTMPSLKSGLQLQKCSRNTPAVRSPADVQREFDATRVAIMAGLPDDSPTRLELEIDLQDIWLSYEQELQAAGSDTGRQAQLQERLHNQLQTMRETAPQLVELTRRYGISFTARSSVVLQRGEIHQYHRAWTSEELRIMDALLARVPREYLRNIRKIQRSPVELDPSVSAEGSTPPADAAASWEQSSQTLRVYDLFFRREEHERLGMILHEVGHSTVVSRLPAETGGFTSLPSDEWMRLSDWKTATSSTLATSVGINEEQARQLISELTANKRTQRGTPRPVERNNRMVVYDKYERGGDDRAPTQFLHYQKDKPFVSNYARTHPAEDFAESFSRYLHDPRLMITHTAARELMGEDKWRFLETRHPQRLQPAQ
jgi:hypothetical protein